MTRIPALISLLLALLSPAWAQEVRPRFHARTQGDDLLVAVEITPDFGVEFYDPSGAGGLPTTVTFSGVDGARWTETWFPEAHEKEDPFVGTKRVYEERTVLYAAAIGAGGADLSGLTARLEGQACNEMSCLPFGFDLEAPGEGTAALWDGFPAALLAGDGQPEARGAGASQAQGQGDGAPVWSPVFGEEVAMARFFGRVDDDDLAQVVIQVAVPEGFHMYGGPTDADKGPGAGIPTTITIEGGGVEWGAVTYPKPHRYLAEGAVDPEKDWFWVYDGTFHFGVEGDALEGFEPEEIEILVSGQSCDDSGCILVDLKPAYAGEGDGALYAAAFTSWTLPEAPSADAGSAPEGAEEAEAGAEGAGGSGGAAAAEDDGPRVFGQGTRSEGGLLGFILLAIGAGLITLLMPCTYPMIPITLSFFTKQADARGGNVLPLALVYGAGIISIFVVIGIVVGPAIVPFAGHFVTNIVIGLLFLVFAGSLFGMFELRPPAFLMNAAGSATQKGGYGGVFLMGLTLVITSFTCTAPFVGGLLAAGGGGYLKIAIGMFFFGLTMATPFVFLALVPGRLSRMPSAGAWMNTLKVFMGFVELAASLKFFSNADITMHWMILPREVFLALWAGIFVVAGMYLLGRINLKGEAPEGNIGPGRMMGGLANILFGLYCFLGTLGYQLDGFIMGAMAPPPTYSRGLVLTHVSQGGPAAPAYPEGIAALEGGPVAVDDYDAALAFARESGRGLMINFTAHY